MWFVVDNLCRRKVVNWEASRKLCLLSMLFSIHCDNYRVWNKKAAKIKDHLAKKGYKSYHSRNERKSSSFIKNSNSPSQSLLAYLNPIQWKKNYIWSPNICPSRNQPSMKLSGTVCWSQKYIHMFLREKIPEAAMSRAVRLWSLNNFQEPGIILIQYHGCQY